MCLSSPKIPAPVAPPPMPTPQDPAVLAAQDADRRRRAAAAGGYRSTLLTGGAQSPITTPIKTLLGQ